MGVIIPEAYAKLDFKIQLLGKPDPYVISMGAATSTIVGGFDAAVDDLNTNLQIAGHLFGAAQFIGYYTYRGIDATRMTGTGPVVYSVTANQTGTKTGNAMPPNVSLLVRKNTGAGGRRGRGRLFFPPAWIGEADVGPSGDLDPTAKTSWQTLVSSLLTDMTAQDLLPVLLHSDGGTPDLVTSLSAESIVATQRRRLR